VGVYVEFEPKSHFSINSSDSFSIKYKQDIHSLRAVKNKQAFKETSGQARGVQQLAVNCKTCQ